MSTTGFGNILTPARTGAPDGVIVGGVRLRREPGH